MKAFFTFFAMLAAAAVSAGEPVRGVWTDDWQAVAQIAKTNGTPVLLRFTGSDWSPPCNRLEREVFSRDAWKSWASTNLYLVEVDFPADTTRQTPLRRAINQALAERFGVESYPALVLLSSDLAEIGRPETEPGAPPAFYVRQIVVALAEADPAALRAALGGKDAARYLELKGRIDSYSARAAELSRRVEEESARLRTARERAPTGEASEAAQAELFRTISKRVSEYRDFQDRETPAVRECARLLEEYRDRIAGPAGRLPPSPPSATR